MNAAIYNETTMSFPQFGKWDGLESQAFGQPPGLGNAGREDDGAQRMAQKRL
jgi:hypothetical protein